MKKYNILPNVAALGSFTYNIKMFANNHRTSGWITVIWPALKVLIVTVIDIVSSHVRKLYPDNPLRIQIRISDLIVIACYTIFPKFSENSLPLKALFPNFQCSIGKSLSSSFSYIYWRTGDPIRSIQPRQQRWEVYQRFHDRTLITRHAAIAAAARIIFQAFTGSNNEGLIGQIRSSAVLSSRSRVPLNELASISSLRSLAPRPSSFQCFAEYKWKREYVSVPWDR